MGLIVKNVSKRYGHKIVLDNINLTLSNGVYGIVGANGAGKTTLINIIVGLIKPDNGSIFYDNKNCYELGEKYLDKIGYLPQYLGCYKNFTAKEFLKYIASIKGVDKKNIEEKVNDLLDLVNLKNDSNKRVSTFSGGMRQRLGIAQALLNDPDILILDEPTAGLDPKERIRLRNIIASLSDKKIVLISTHIVSDIEFIAKKIILLQDGQIVRFSDSNSIIDETIGKVWQVEVNSMKVNDLMLKNNVSGIYNKNNKFILRIISDEKPRCDSYIIKPTLEEACLYYLGKL